MIRLIAATLAGMAFVAGGIWAGAPERSADATVVFLVEATPESATNLVNTDHTITATATDSVFGNPLVGFDVTFDVTLGPNAGDPVGQGITDANGQATFTYNGNSGAGIDTIEVCIFPPIIGRIAGLGQPSVGCDTVSKTWVDPTPTPSPAPPTPTLAASTATPSPAAPVSLPGTGGQERVGSNRPWTAIALFAVLALASLAGTAALRRGR